MYDEIVKTIQLTFDEVLILKNLLETHQDFCISHGEILTVDGILDKLYD